MYINVIEDRKLKINSTCTKNARRSADKINLFWMGSGCSRDYYNPFILAPVCWCAVAAAAATLKNGDGLIMK